MCSKLQLVNAIYFNAVNIYWAEQLVINLPVLAHTCGSYAESWVPLGLCNMELVCVDLSPRYIPHSYLQSFICSAVFVYLW